MRLLIFLTALGLIFTFAQASQARDLQLTDYLNWERAGGPQISPDGDEILYTRQYVDKLKDRWASEIWIMDADGSRHRHLTDGGNVRWSPDGSRIAYITSDGDKAQIHVRWMDAEGAVSQVTREGHRIRSLSWSPDGEQIAYRAVVPYEAKWPIDMPARPEGADWKGSPDIIDKLWFRFDRQGRRHGFTHLFVVDAEAGTPRQVTSGEWDAGRFGDPVWTPDGSSLLFTGVADPDEEVTSQTSNIHIVDIESGTIRRLNSETGNWGNPVVSPDGETVAYVGNTSDTVAGPTYPPVELRLVNIDGTNDRVIVADLGNSPRDLRWAPDGNGLYLTLGREGSTNIVHVGRGGDMRDVTTGEHRFFLSSATDGGQGVGVITSPYVTPNVASVDLDNGAIRQLTDLNADILADVDLGRVEEIRYDSFDGERVQGWIVYPPDFDENGSYPLMLAIHGGPHGMYGVNFSFPFQEMAARGYVVLYTNPRGSTGYGADFANAIDDQYPGPVDYGDLMAGVDTVLERGFINPDRLHVQGCSGGGILTAWVVTQTNRFASAVSRCPIVNWISAAGTTDITNGAHDLFRNRFWDDPQTWMDHSAIFHVNRVETPTLLMVGENDLRTPVPQAEEFYIALKLLGVPTKLLLMKNEWHGTSSTPSNMLRTQLYMRSWFEDHDGSAQTEADANGE